MEYKHESKNRNIVIVSSYTRFLEQPHTRPSNQDIVILSNYTSYLIHLYINIKKLIKERLLNSNNRIYIIYNKTHYLYKTKKHLFK